MDRLGARPLGGHRAGCCAVESRRGGFSLRRPRRASQHNQKAAVDGADDSTSDGMAKARSIPAKITAIPRAQASMLAGIHSPARWIPARLRTRHCTKESTTPATGA